MKKISFVSLILIVVTTLIFALSKIINWQTDTDAINTIIQQVQSTTTDDGQIDFDALKRINSDTIGWLRLAGTKIDYPVVQTDNNQFYLSHSFDKTINSAGWIFMDYRNVGLNEQNTIIYAHGRLDGTMFGSLRTTLTNEWQAEYGNHNLLFITPTDRTYWRLFSVYKIPTTDDYLQTVFTDTEFESFIEMIANRSLYDFQTPIASSNQILTLSTCYNDNEKIVLHFKKINQKP